MEQGTGRGKKRKEKREGRVEALECRRASQVVFHVVQRPVLPCHHPSCHLPHRVQQTANVLDAFNGTAVPVCVCVCVCVCV